MLGRADNRVDVHGDDPDQPSEDESWCAWGRDIPRGWSAVLVRLGSAPYRRLALWAALSGLPTMRTAGDASLRADF